MMDKQQYIELNIQRFAEVYEMGEIKHAEELVIEIMELLRSEKLSESTLSGENVFDTNEISIPWYDVKHSQKIRLSMALEQKDFPVAFKASIDLVDIYRAQGAFVEALDTARSAFEFAQHLNLVALLIMALEALSAIYIETSNFAMAKESIESLIQIIPAKKIYEVNLARALTLLAHCQIHFGEIEQARVNLQSAWSVLKLYEQTSVFMGGQYGLAGYWEVLSFLQQVEVDIDGAVQSLGKSVDIRRFVASQSHLDGPYKHYTFAKSLRRYAIVLISTKNINLATRTLNELSDLLQKTSIVLPNL